MNKQNQKKTQQPPIYPYGVQLDVFDLRFVKIACDFDYASKKFLKLVYVFQ